MASYRARATGNWSDVNTWSVWSGSAWVNATNIPSNADDVWSNNFVVTINQDVTVLTIRNSTTGAPGTGTTTGGGFRITTGGITFVCTNSILSQHAGASSLLNISHSTGTVNVTLTYFRGSNGSNQVLLLFTIGGTGTTNWTGSLQPSGPNGSMMNFGNGVLNLVGDISFAALAGSAAVVLSAGSGTVNFTGNISTGNVGGPQTGIGLGGTVTCNIIGNINATNTAANNISPISMTTGTLTVNGEITGGQGVNAILISGAAYFSHNGICRAGNQNSIGAGSAAVGCSNASSIAIFSGPFIFGNYGGQPFNCARMFLSNNTNNYIDFATDSTNGALFPLPAPTRTQLVSPNTIVDAPDANNVRFGIVYANNTQTGTLRMAAPDRVSKGVLTDATVGTAALTPEDVWNLALSAINTPNSIGDRLKNVATVESTGNQISSLLNT